MRMAWNFVSSRRLQTGHRYGVWVTSAGVTSTEDLARWIRTKGWTDVTLLPRGTLATGQMVKEMHALWGGGDGTVLPVSDRHLGYGPLYLAESPSDDPGDVPNRAPGERPPHGPEVDEAMRRATAPKSQARWKVPVMVAGALGFLLLVNARKPDYFEGGVTEEDEA